MASRELAAIELMLHELRTPLNVLSGSLSQLASAPSPGDADKAALDRARRASDRLETVLQQARQWARRLSSPSTGSTSLAPVLASAMQSASESRGGGVEARVDAAPPDVTVALSADALAEALGALLDAVFRGAHDNSVVNVAAHVAATTPRSLTLTIGEAGNTERGTFDAEWRGGLGFSLPLARAVVESAGGEIWSREEAGRLVGAGLRLPLA